MDRILSEALRFDEKGENCRCSYTHCSPPPSSANQHIQSPILDTPKRYQPESLDLQIESNDTVTQLMGCEEPMISQSSPSVFAHYGIQIRMFSFGARNIDTKASNGRQVESNVNAVIQSSNGCEKTTESKSSSCVFAGDGSPINKIYFGADNIEASDGSSNIGGSIEHTNLCTQIQADDLQMLNKSTISQGTQTTPPKIVNCTEVVECTTDNASPSHTGYLNFTESEISQLSQRLHMDEFDLLRNIYEMRQDTDPITQSLAQASNNDDHELSELDRTYRAILAGNDVNSGDDISVISASPPNSPLGTFFLDDLIFDDNE